LRTSFGDERERVLEDDLLLRLRVELRPRGEEEAHEDDGREAREQRHLLLHPCEAALERERTLAQIQARAARTEADREAERLGEARQRGGILGGQRGHLERRRGEHLDRHLERGREEAKRAGDVGAASTQEETGRRLAALRAMSGDRRPELARELRGGAGEALRAEGDGAREDRLTVLQHEDVARDGSEVDNRNDALTDDRHVGKKTRDGKCTEADPLRLDGECGLHELDARSDVGGLRDPDENGQLLPFVSRRPGRRR